LSFVAQPQVKGVKAFIFFGVGGIHIVAGHSLPLESDAQTPKDLRIIKNFRIGDPAWGCLHSFAAVVVAAFHIIHIFMLGIGAAKLEFQLSYVIIIYVIFYAAVQCFARVAVLGGTIT